MNNIKNRNLSELLKGLDNKWVLLSNDNSSILEVSDEIDEIKNISAGILLKVPDSTSYCAPNFCRQ